MEGIVRLKMTEAHRRIDMDRRGEGTFTILQATSCQTNHVVVFEIKKNLKFDFEKKKTSIKRSKYPTCRQVLQKPQLV